MDDTDCSRESVASLARIRDTYAKEHEIWFALAQTAQSERDWLTCLCNSSWHKQKAAELSRQIEKRLARSEAFYGAAPGKA